MSNLQVRVLPNVDVSHLSRHLLDDGGRMRLLSAATLREIDPDHLALWCQKNGRYGIPTVELIAFLRDKIGGRSAIEVGSGMGDLGYHLGLRMTDSFVQLRPDMQFLYALMQTAVTRPPPDVEVLDAEAAVEKYRPQVLLASWLTQKYEPGDENPPKVGSSIYGPDEKKMLGRVETYLHVGNRITHKDKRILALPHEEHVYPWIVSRAGSQADNVVFEWKGSRPSHPG